MANWLRMDNHSSIFGYFCRLGVKCLFLFFEEYDWYVAILQNCSINFQRMENVLNGRTVDIWPFALYQYPTSRRVLVEFCSCRIWGRALLTQVLQELKRSLQVTWSPGPRPITVLRCLHSSYGNQWIKTFYTTHIQVIHVSDVSQSDMTRTLKPCEYWL